MELRKTSIALILAVVGALVACGADSNPESASDEAGGAGGTSGAGEQSDAGSAGASEEAGAAGAPPAELCGASEPEEGFVEVPATDPAIRYLGRFDWSVPEAPMMWFPALGIETVFTGDALDMVLDERASGGVITTDYYEIRLDDEEPITLRTCAEQDVYPLARDLEPGPHRVRISKRTEVQVGNAAFLGLRIRPDASLTLPPEREHRIEVVGDSITCGYGNELSTTTPDDFPFTSQNENALGAYGAVAAELLDADYVAVAGSGRGMVRNYGGFVGLFIPEFYELTSILATASTWDHSLYSPELIVINAGTNDFSPGLDSEQYLAMREEFRNAYRAFLIRLRELHPEAALVAAIGPMLSDGYPEGYEALTSIRADVSGVVDALVEEGDDRVWFFEFAAQTAPYGEDWHPTLATHRAMGEALAEFVRAELGWD